MKKTQKKIVATAVLGVVLLGGATQHQSIAVQATNVEANQRVSSSSGIVGTVGIVGVVSTPLFITATSQLSHRG
ncbi:MAG: hypothetical protein FWG67_00855, partial [Defluviitaleaceae bacterium]|nr:hypothetical protein [Defluviitaleaceae bacterium]